MTISDFKDVDKSVNDTRMAINEKEEYPEFFEHHMERLEWAIETIDGFSRNTSCQHEQELINKRDSFVSDLNLMKEAQ